MTAANEDAVAELLEDAARARRGDGARRGSRDEAEELRALNERLASAAEEVAAMVAADDTSMRSSGEHLEALEREAAAAKEALAAAEARSEADRDALLRRARGLEVDLAEAEGALDATGGDAAAELDEARKKVDALTALARRRGDDLLAAEAEAEAAAAEVASLKRQLAPPPTRPSRASANSRR